MIIQEIDLEHVTARTIVYLQCDVCSNEFTRIAYIVKNSRKNQGCDLCPSCARKATSKRAGKIIQNRYKGKKIEEIVGEERGDKIRKLLSFQRLGEKNHNYQGRHQKFPVRTGSFIEQYGEEKAAIIKKKISIATTGSNNPMYGKPSPKRSGSGISGHFKQYYFRSLLELTFILNMLDKNIKFESCDGHKNFRFNYKINGIDKTYFPDFYLKDTDEFIEVKPARQTVNEIVILKSLAVKESGHNFRFVTEKDLLRINKDELMKMISIGDVLIDENKKHLVERRAQ